LGWSDLDCGEGKRKPEPSVIVDEVTPHETGSTLVLHLTSSPLVNFPHGSFILSFLSSFLSAAVVPPPSRLELKLGRPTHGVSSSSQVVLSLLPSSFLPCLAFPRPCRLKPAADTIRSPPRSRLYFFFFLASNRSHIDWVGDSAKHVPSPFPQRARTAGAMKIIEV
jgi:hypothetical protein